MKEVGKLESLAEAFAKAFSETFEELIKHFSVLTWAGLRAGLEKAIPFYDVILAGAMRLTTGSRFLIDENIHVSWFNELIKFIITFPVYFIFMQFFTVAGAKPSKKAKFFGSILAASCIAFFTAMLNWETARIVEYGGSSLWGKMVKAVLVLALLIALVKIVLSLLFGGVFGAGITLTVIVSRFFIKLVHKALDLAIAFAGATFLLLIIDSLPNAAIQNVAFYKQIGLGFLALALLFIIQISMDFLFDTILKD